MDSPPALRMTRTNSRLVHAHDAVVARSMTLQVISGADYSHPQLDTIMPARSWV